MFINRSVKPTDADRLGGMLATKAVIDLGLKCIDVLFPVMLHLLNKRRNRLTKVNAGTNNIDAMWYDVTTMTGVWILVLTYGQFEKRTTLEYNERENGCGQDHSRKLPF